MLRKIDIPFLVSVGLLLGVGFLIFTSASLGLLAREQGATFSSVALNQLIFGVGGGSIAFIIAFFLPVKLLRRHALALFGVALFVTSLVFVPYIGFEANGAARWINLGFTTFQPAELLKLAFVIYLAVWFTNVRDKMRKSFWYGTPPILLFLGVVGGLLLSQPDTGTFMIFSAAALGMFVAAGARVRDVTLLVLVSIALVGILAITRPYVMDRITTFLDPSADQQGLGYQVDQSLIAVGSGGWFGRGFGQSVQKFNFLPEPTSDSIFSVAAEEFGIVGAFGLIALITFFAWRGFVIAAGAPDQFSGLLAVGIVILIVSQAFINIGSMLGIMPLSGVPLPFVSKGGTALLFALFEAGLLLQISTKRRMR